MILNIWPQTKQHQQQLWNLLYMQILWSQLRPWPRPMNQKFWEQTQQCGFEQALVMMLRHVQVGELLNCALSGQEKSMSTHCLTLVLQWKKLKRLNGRSHFVPIWTEMPTIKPYNIIWRKMNPYKCSLLDNWAIGRLSNQRFLITFPSSLKKTNSYSALPDCPGPRQWPWTPFFWLTLTHLP